MARFTVNGRAFNIDVDPNTPGGIGEPTICVAAPAVMNAYAKATSTRIRSFPLKNHKLQIA